MKRYILFILFLIIPFNVLAVSKTSCNYSLVAKLKGLANNVNITYSYEINNDMVKYSIELVNISEDIYFIDNNTKNKYYYSDTINGSIKLNGYSSGNVRYTFYSNNSDCMNEKLVVKNVNLPYYNKFYKYDECIGIEEFNLCKKWIKYDGFYDDFVRSVNEYKSSLINNDIDNKVSNVSIFNKIVDFILKYYYITMLVIVLIIYGIMYLVKYIKYRKNRFDI